MNEISALFRRAHRKLCNPFLLYKETKKGQPMCNPEKTPETDTMISEL
jgi:hypothetical protein